MSCGVHTHGGVEAQSFLVGLPAVQFEARCAMLPRTGSAGREEQSADSAPPVRHGDAKVVYEANRPWHEHKDIAIGMAQVKDGIADDLSVAVRQQYVAVLTSDQLREVSLRNDHAFATKD